MLPDPTDDAPSEPSDTNEIPVRTTKKLGKRSEKRAKKAPGEKSLPDLVQDSRIETQVVDHKYHHVFVESGLSVQQRQVRREEVWIRASELGRGAYGTVYLERCELGERSQGLRAVKEIKKSVKPGEALDYLRELEAVVKFSHVKYAHCFVRSEGWFELSDSIFIVMEYLQLGDLERHLSYPLPECEAKQITGQVLEGLQFMHENAFIHRDLKPGNIMVVTRAPEWFVKITDFGISKRRREDVTTLQTLQRGTLGYAAPEVFGCGTSDVSYSSPVDIWSLGTLVYRVLTGAVPFPNLADLILFANGAKEFPIQGLNNNRISEDGKQFIKEAMSPDPRKRPSAALASGHFWLISTQQMPPVLQDSEARAEELQIEQPVAPTGISVASKEWSDESTRALTLRPNIPKSSLTDQEPSGKDCSEDAEDDHRVYPSPSLSSDQELCHTCTVEKTADSPPPGPPVKIYHKEDNHTLQFKDCRSCRKRWSPPMISQFECGHWMCSPCLRDAFRDFVDYDLEISPRCCGSPIPLKYVQPLLDTRFMAIYNKKIAAFQTRSAPLLESFDTHAAEEVKEKKLAKAHSTSADTAYVLRDQNLRFWDRLHRLPSLHSRTHDDRNTFGDWDGRNMFTMTCHSCERLLEYEMSTPKGPQPALLLDHDICHDCTLQLQALSFLSPCYFPPGCSCAACASYVSKDLPPEKRPNTIFRSTMPVMEAKDVESQLLSLQRVGSKPMCPRGHPPINGALAVTNTTLPVWSPTFCCIGCNYTVWSQFSGTDLLVQTAFCIFCCEERLLQDPYCSCYLATLFRSTIELAKESNMYGQGQAGALVKMALEIREKMLRGDGSVQLVSWKRWLRNLHQKDAKIPLRHTSEYRGSQANP